MNSARWFIALAAVSGVSQVSAQSGSTGGQAAAVAAATVSAVASVTQGQSGAAVAATVATPTLPRTGTSTEARVVNLSTRARIGPGNPLISGFAIRGEGTRRLLVRAVGPSLGVFGVNDPVAAPRLQVFNGNQDRIAENSGWAATPQSVAEIGQAIASAGAFPFAANSGRDAALVVTVSEGTYTL